MSRDYPAASLARIETLRTLQHNAAEAALAKAAQEERRTRDAHDRAGRQRDDALARWHEQLAGSAFSPELSSGLAAAFSDSDARAEAAGAEAARAASARRTCEARWRQSEAQCRQVGALLGESRRHEARARDEKALLEIADRVTFAWRRR